jgi:hypothetical protein
LPERRDRRSEGKEDKVLTSVYLPLRQKEWIKQRGFKQSQFVREAVEEKIIRESGFQTQIAKRREKIEILKDEIAREEMVIEELNAKHQEWVKEQEENELLLNVETAIYKVGYMNAAEAARDLKSLRPEGMAWGDWLRFIAETWKRIRGDKKR